MNWEFIMFSEWRFFVTEFLGLVNVLKGSNVHGYEELYILHREGLSPIWKSRGSSSGNLNLKTTEEDQSGRGSSFIWLLKDTT